MLLLGGFILFWAALIASYTATVRCRGTECTVEESWLRLRTTRTFRVAPVLGIEAQNGAVVLSTRTGPVLAIAPLVTRSLTVRVQWEEGACEVRDGRAAVSSGSFGIAPGCMLLALAVFVGRRQFIAVDQVESRLIAGCILLGRDCPMESISTSAIRELHATESDGRPRIVVQLEGDTTREITVRASSEELAEAERALRDALG